MNTIVKKITTKLNKMIRENSSRIMTHEKNGGTEHEYLDGKATAFDEVKLMLSSIKDKINLKDLEAKAEQHALGQYLSEYPADMGYDDILERLSDDRMDNDEGETIIVVWEPFENRAGAALVENITDTKDSTLELLKDVFK